MRAGGVGVLQISAWRWLKERLSGSLELPQDVIMDLPKVIITGGMQLQIENHKGILEYTPRCIRIATAQGEVVVNGTRLRIHIIMPQEMAVAGCIDNVNIVD